MMKNCEEMEYLIFGVKLQFCEDRIEFFLNNMFFYNLRKYNHLLNSGKINMFYLKDYHEILADKLLKIDNWSSLPKHVLKNDNELEKEGFKIYDDINNNSEKYDTNTNVLYSEIL